MAVFDALINDIAGKFGLGSNAGPLVREILNMVANAPGGIGGFLSKLQSAGLRSEVESWLGHPNAAPLPAQDLDRTLGFAAFSGIANRFGISEATVKAAVGYVLPKLIGALTPGGRIPTSLPAEAQAFLTPRVAEPGARGASGSPARVTERAATASLGLNRNESDMSRWFWPVLGSLAVLGLGLFLYNRAPVSRVTAQAPAPLPATADGVRLPAGAPNTASAQKGSDLALTEQEAKAWVDKPVYSADGTKVGQVWAFLLTPDNKVAELHADIGGFLGMGEHRIRLEPAQFSLLSDRIVLDLTAAQAGNLPKIQK